MCPALLDPINGAVTWTSLTEGGVATYVCDDGFELEGSMTRTCESSGMWSGEEPLCRGMLITPLYKVTYVLHVLICTLLNAVHSIIIIIISKRSIHTNGSISVPTSSCYVSCPFGSYQWRCHVD